jgi:hypothetical protein
VAAPLDPIPRAKLSFPVVGLGSPCSRAALATTAVMIEVTVTSMKHETSDVDHAASGHAAEVDNPAVGYGAVRSNFT